MDSRHRERFNAGFTADFYRSYLNRLERRVGSSIPFRVAETPFFIPADLRKRLVRHATEIVERISAPALIEKLKAAVPARLDVPNLDPLANCIQVDFAIVRDAEGNLDAKLVELQGFPSLYALTVLQTEAMSAQLQTIPGLDRPWTSLFNGLDRTTYIERLRAAIVGECRSEEVILMDLDPPSQKTAPDFVATKEFIGVDAVCPTTLQREGRTLYRMIDGRRVPVRRIFNRVVFDELLKKGITLPFSYTEDLDVTWIPHPNWYWIWSKYTIPHIDHSSVPRAQFLSDVKSLPDDLSKYVLKPLFSFAGTGVMVEFTREDVAAVPERERGDWLLQEKIAYAPDLRMPDGNGVKAEVRMMFLRAPEQARPELVLNLVRLSRGKMHGVDHNKNFEWVGGTVGIWPADE